MAARKKSSPFWECEDLLKEKPNARYYVVLSGRSRGKTYSVLRNAIKDNLKKLGLFAYVRRYDEEIKQKNLIELFGAHDIKKYTKGKYNKISYFRGFFYFELWGTNEETGKYERLSKDPKPCGVAIAINTWEKNKGQDIGAAYGGFKHIILDEMITGLSYLPDEVQKFKNVISSLVRTRTDQDTKIWLLANPLSKWCPYFQEFGITQEMLKEPEKDAYYEIHYPDTDMVLIFAFLSAKIAIEKQDNVYTTFFAFPNSKSKSKAITSGFWELDDSVQLPSKVYRNSERKYKFYLYFSEQWLKGEIMRYDNGVFYLVWSPSLEAPKDKEYYFILNAVPDKYAIIGTETGHPLAQLVNKIIDTGQVYYSDNATADIYHGFLNEAYKIER